MKFPQQVATKVARYGFVLVCKHSLDFLGCEPEDATQAEHTKWFMNNWFKDNYRTSYHKTAEAAIEQGLQFGEKDKNYGYWWCVFDKSGKDIDGAY